MKCLALTARIDASGVDQSGEEFINVEIEIGREFEIVHIFFDLELV